MTNTDRGRPDLDTTPGPTEPAPPGQVQVLWAIAAGGAVGATLRHLLEVAVPTADSDGWPWAVLTANLLGSLLLGLLMGLLASGRSRWPLLRPFAGVGVLGGFTTMSTFAVGVVSLSTPAPGAALGYLAATTAGTVAAALLGWLCTVRLRHAPDPPDRPVTSGGGPSGRGAPVASAGRILVGPVMAGVVLIGVVLAAVVAAGSLATGDTSVLWVALGAAIGAPLRHLIGQGVQARHTSELPWGTATVNVLGSLGLGLLTVAPPTLWLLLGVGLCGAGTTWSTAAHEVATLLRRRRFGAGVGYALGTVALCVVAAAVGVWLVGGPS